MENPFEEIIKRLDKIERLLSEGVESKVIDSKFEKIPVQDIFKRKMLSKPTFYKRVKEGNITIYKMGGRSYVDVKEFNQAFNKIKI